MLLVANHSHNDTVREHVQSSFGDAENDKRVRFNVLPSVKFTGFN